MGVQSSVRAGLRWSWPPAPSSEPVRVHHAHPPRLFAPCRWGDPLAPHRRLTLSRSGTLCSAWQHFKHHKIHVLFISGVVVRSPFPCWRQRQRKHQWLPVFLCAVRACHARRAQIVLGSSKGILQQQRALPAPCQKTIWLP